MSTHNVRTMSRTLLTCSALLLIHSSPALAVEDEPPGPSVTLESFGSLIELLLKLMKHEKAPRPPEPGCSLPTEAAWKGVSTTPVVFADGTHLTVKVLLQLPPKVCPFKLVVRRAGTESGLVSGEIVPHQGGGALSVLMPFRFDGLRPCLSFAAVASSNRKSQYVLAERVCMARHPLSVNHWTLRPEVGSVAGKN